MGVTQQRKKCTYCNAEIFEDETVTDCLGECGREIHTETQYFPLDFENDPTAHFTGRYEEEYLHYDNLYYEDEELGDYYE